jgi:3-carboxy-cis,cis-muconate cycloisomerase
VGPEALLTLARLASALVGPAHEAMIHAHEREGAAWALEWHVLPQICMAAAAATTHAWRLADTLEADPVRMLATIEATNGLMLAEAATFALARHMPRPEAQAVVKDACKRAASEGRHPREVLSAATDAPVDWNKVFDPMNYVGEAREFVDRLVAEASKL